MPEYVAFVTKGLEDMAAAELPAPRIGTKHVLFSAPFPPPTPTTVDDVCVLLGPPPHLPTPDHLRTFLYDEADLPMAIELVSGLRGMDGTFSVTVTAARSPLGGAAAITAVAAEAVTRRLGWQHRDGARAPFDLRVFADGPAAIVGVRVFDGPLSDRAYRQVHVRGALRPTVAAAMMRLVGAPGGRLWDPFCGSGTILAEAAIAGYDVSGTDLDAAAADAATHNLTAAAPGPRERVERADSTLEATWRRHDDADTIVTNLPWGKQVAIDRASVLYDAVGRGLAVLSRRGGRACVLTTDPDRLAASVRRYAPALYPTLARRPISLLGQAPTLLTLPGRGSATAGGG